MKRSKKTYAWGVEKRTPVVEIGGVENHSQLRFFLAAAVERFNLGSRFPQPSPRILRHDSTGTEGTGVTITKQANTAVRRALENYQFDEGEFPTSDLRLDPNRDNLLKPCANSVDERPVNGRYLPYVKILPPERRGALRKRLPSNDMGRALRRLYRQVHSRPVGQSQHLPGKPKSSPFWLDNPSLPVMTPLLARP